eukprot:11867103-Alexandrium_andersonii.AAC.2
MCIRDSHKKETGDGCAISEGALSQAHTHTHTRTRPHGWGASRKTTLEHTCSGKASMILIRTPWYRLRSPEPTFSPSRRVPISTKQFIGGSASVTRKTCERERACPVKASSSTEAPEFAARFRTGARTHCETPPATGSWNDSPRGPSPPTGLPPIVAGLPVASKLLAFKRRPIVVLRRDDGCNRNEWACRVEGAAAARRTPTPHM